MPVMNRSGNREQEPWENTNENHVGLPKLALYSSNITFIMQKVMKAQAAEEEEVRAEKQRMSVHRGNCSRNRVYRV